MGSTHEGLAYKNPMDVGMFFDINNSSKWKSLRQFWALFNVKQKTDVRGLENDKTKLKTIRAGSFLFSSIPKKRLHTKKCIIKALYKCALRNPQVFQSTIPNECLKVSIYIKNRKQVVPRLLF